MCLLGKKGDLGRFRVRRGFVLLMRRFDCPHMVIFWGGIKLLVEVFFSKSKVSPLWDLT